HVRGGYWAGIREKGFLLETDGALAEPEVLGHLLDQQLLGRGGGIVFFDETRDESVEGFGIFAFDYRAAGGEAVAQRVLAGAGFAVDGLRACGRLRVGAIGRELRSCSHR